MYLFSYTKFSTNAMSFIISIVIFVMANFGYKSFAKKITSIQKKRENTPVQEQNLEEQTQPKILYTKEENEDLQKINDNVWEIEIKKINLKAPIHEGTTKEVMNEFVGHFENTSIWKGNVGLAAHNRGFPINYFARVKELKKGDEIIYRTPYGERIYEVNLITVIEDTDWTYLKTEDENVITLITCVENRPRNRRCIQGIQKKQEVNILKDLIKIKKGL